ncbi:hypothetical protein [Actinomadura sp. GTD37]|uniref:hypothetical protein n=1 Tax=Actinomadura sp. GTD37 TaxID=1778030 RepID=UPI0035BF1F0B
MTDQPNNIEPDDAGRVRPFAAILQDINGGEFATQIAGDMQDLVTAVRDLGRKGTLTLKFEVAPRKGSSTALNVTARRDLKMPAEEPIESVFFADSGGNLLRDDPRQLALPDLRTVTRGQPDGGDLRRAGQ